MFLEILILCGKYVFTFLIAAVFCYAVYVRYQHQKYDHIPGPPRRSFWTGNLNLIADSMKEHGHMYNAIIEMVKQYGHTTKFFIFHEAFVYTVDRDSIKNLLVTGGHSKSKEYERIRYIFGARIFGHGIVTELDHCLWSWKRLNYNPLFTRSVIRGKFEYFVRNADTLMDKLYSLADGKTKITMLEEFKRAALDIIAQVSFGMDIKTINNKNSRFYSAFDDLLTGLQKSFFIPGITYNPSYRQFRSLVRDQVNFIRSNGKQLMETRRLARENGETIPDDFISVTLNILEQQPNITIDEMIDDYFALFIAGHETTAAILSFAVLMLGQHSQSLKRLQDEIDEKSSTKTCLTCADIMELEYLDAVLKEILRLFPVGLETSRQSNVDTFVGGYVVPANTPMRVSMYVASRLENAFTDPGEFRPERFLKKNSEKMHTVYNYFPFSLGPRSCIGQHFAKMETKVVLFKFLQKFDFELDPSQSFGTEQVFTLHPKDGVILTLRPREHLHES